MTARGNVVAGRYRLGALLGEGGMGAVFEATHLHTGARWAVKIAHARTAGGDEAAARFLREARVYATIGHPGIVEVVDGGVDGDTLFLVMELLQGENLRRRFERLGTHVEGKLSLVERMLDPLAAAHVRGLVHRDLKPENVFVATHGGREEVKLLDFGLAFDARSASLTAPGARMGSAPYMSPEQWRGAGAVTPVIDVWATGIILYEALAGHRPFRGTDGEIMIQARTQAHAPIPNAPSAVAALIDACLQKDPDRRPRNAGEVSALLSAARRAAHAPPAPTQWEPAPTPAPGVTVWEPRPGEAVDDGPTSTAGTAPRPRRRLEAAGAGVVLLFAVYLITHLAVNASDVPFEAELRVEGAMASVLVSGPPGATVEVERQGETREATIFDHGQASLPLPTRGLAPGRNELVARVTVRERVGLLWRRSSEQVVRHEPRAAREPAAVQTFEQTAERVYAYRPSGRDVRLNARLALDNGSSDALSVELGEHHIPVPAHGHVLLLTEPHELDFEVLRGGERIDALSLDLQAGHAYVYNADGLRNYELSTPSAPGRPPTKRRLPPAILFDAGTVNGLLTTPSGPPSRARFLAHHHSLEANRVTRLTDGPWSHVVAGGSASRPVVTLQPRGAPMLAAAEVYVDGNTRRGAVVRVQGVVVAELPVRRWVRLHIPPGPRELSVAVGDDVRYRIERPLEASRRYVWNPGRNQSYRVETTAYGDLWFQRPAPERLGRREFFEVEADYVFVPFPSSIEGPAGSFSITKTRVTRPGL